MPQERIAFVAGNTVHAISSSLPSDLATLFRSGQFSQSMDIDEREERRAAALERVASVVMASRTSSTNNPETPEQDVSQDTANDRSTPGSDVSQDIANDTSTPYDATQKLRELNDALEERVRRRSTEMQSGGHEPVPLYNVGDYGDAYGYDAAVGSDLPLAGATTLPLVCGIEENECAFQSPRSEALVVFMRHIIRRTLQATDADRSVFSAPDFVRMWTALSTEEAHRFAYFLRGHGYDTSVATARTPEDRWRVQLRVETSSSGGADARALLIPTIQVPPPSPPDLQRDMLSGGGPPPSSSGSSADILWAYEVGRQRALRANMELLDRELHHRAAQRGELGPGTFRLNLGWNAGSGL